MHLVDEEIAAVHHRRARVVLAGLAPPHQDLVHFLVLPRGLGHRLVGLHLVVGDRSGSVIAVHGYEHPAAGVRDARAAGVAGESAEYLGVNDAEARAGQHRDRQLGHHRHVQGDPVASLQPGEILQQGRELVDPAQQLAVADGDCLVVLKLGHPDNRGLVRVGLRVPVDAVIASVQLAAAEPLPERRVAGVEHRVPALVPGQQVGIFGKAVRELVLGEPVKDRWIVRVSLLNERLRRRVILLLAPVHSDLGFRDFLFRVLGHPCPPGRS